MEGYDPSGTASLGLLLLSADKGVEGFMSPMLRGWRLWPEPYFWTRHGLNPLLNFPMAHTLGGAVGVVVVGALFGWLAPPWWFVPAVVLSFAAKWQWDLLERYDGGYPVWLAIWCWLFDVVGVGLAALLGLGS